MKILPVILLITAIAMIQISPQLLADAQHIQDHSAPAGQTEPVTYSTEDPSDSENNAEDSTETIPYRTIKYAGKFHPIADL
ncbi:hypothetical protein [Rubritalea profundi]|uniref:Uncharacterized protein n=1 Tax=Rubritalea profundi TaxID=1658618 RepID=A0A2S7U3Q1_9BACT|nr:hypothetical protein [Rubritalea profundi]PQJ29061.1 hypothetical protein BSZ32_11540 [Rubritalea profundi]